MVVVVVVLVAVVVEVVVAAVDAVDAATVSICSSGCRSGSMGRSSSGRGGSRQWWVVVALVVSELQGQPS